MCCRLHNRPDVAKNLLWNGALPAVPNDDVVLSTLFWQADKP